MPAELARQHCEPRSRETPPVPPAEAQRLRAELSTHAIKDLSRNDFVLAARIDALPRAQ